MHRPITDFCNTSGRQGLRVGIEEKLSFGRLLDKLYVLSCGALRQELLAALRQARKSRRPRARGTDRRGHIPNMMPPAERPAEVATRTVPGHWEGDLIKGRRNGSAVGSLVERTTRLIILARLDGTDAVRADRDSPGNSSLCRPPCAKR